MEGHADIERRALELRAVEGGRIEGYAAVFNSPYASRKRGAMPVQTVALIRRLGREGMNARQIGELVGYSRSACDSALRGATHRPVTGGRHVRHYRTA